jgi:hypothetical protein
MIRRFGKTAPSDIVILLGAAVNAAVITGLIIFYLLS